MEKIVLKNIYLLNWYGFVGVTIPVDEDLTFITGENESGKSTILDAICLALYATTPRLNNSEMDGKWEENDADTLDITDTM